MDMGGGEEAEVEMYGESNMETYITLCEIDSQWEFAVWRRELKQALCDNLKGWNGEGDGRRHRREGTCMYLWLTLRDVWQKTKKFCKSIILQLKKMKWQKKKKKKKKKYSNQMVEEVLYILRDL